jgi:hypothetical protein
MEPRDCFILLSLENMRQTQSETLVAGQTFLSRGWLSLVRPSTSHFTTASSSFALSTDQRSLKAECKLSSTDHYGSVLFPGKTSEQRRSGRREDIATRTDKLPVEVHEVLTRCLADFLEPRLMDSHMTVIIPFDNRVIFVRPYPVPQSVFRSCPNLQPDHRELAARLWQTALRAAASWRGLSQGSPRGTAGAAEEMDAAWVSVR